MRMRHLSVGLVCVAALSLAVAGCAPAPPADTSAADTTAITAVRDAWVTSHNAADPDALANLYTEDAVRMTLGQPTTTDRASIRQAFAATFGMGKATAAIHSDEMQLMGDWAFDRGTFSGTMTPAGANDPTTTEGRYIVILRRQPDGSWKIAQSIDNTPTMPSMPAGGGD